MSFVMECVYFNRKSLLPLYSLDVLVDGRAYDILYCKSENFHFLLFIHFIMTERKVHETLIVTTDR